MVHDRSAQDDDGRCVDAIARNLCDGRLEVFNAKSTILASGGAGQAYEPTTNGLIVTGDGMAQAFRIGDHFHLCDPMSFDCA